MGRKRRRGVRRGEKAWTEIVRAFQESGLSSTAFCRREGVALSSLQRWRQRVRPQRDTGFVELVSEGALSTPALPTWSLELTLPNGATIRLQG